MKPIYKRQMASCASSVALVASCAALAFSGTAYAQTNTGEATKAADETVVVVTGIKKGLQDSVAAKRKSSSIIEVISAEDIGKLPDVSIAESLARLPGLAGQRVNGRAQVISIRGFDPDFGATLLNGRLQVSTGDNRAAEFDQYPGELINRGVVYKTPDASLVGAGLSGTVDLSTVHPLDFKKRTIALNARLTTNSNKNSLGGTSSGNRLSFTYIDQFMDGKLGVAVGYAHLDDPTSTRHFKYWGFEDGSSNAGTCLAPGQTNSWCGPVGNAQTQFDAAHARAWRLGGFEATNIDRTNVRDGVIGVVEFHPDENFRSVNDFYYSKFEQHEQNHGLMGSLGVWGGTGPDTATTAVNRPHYSNATFEPIPGAPSSTNGNDTLNIGGTVSNVRLIDRSDFANRKDEMYSIGSRNTWKMADWSMLFDLSTSSATRTETSGTESYAGMGPTLRVDGTGLTSLTYSIPNDGPMSFSSSLNFNDPSLLRLGDVAGWGADGHIRFPKIKDQISQVRFEGSHALEFGIFKSIDMGVAFSQRTKSKAVDEYDLCLKGVTPVCNSTGVALPSAFVTHSDFSYLGLGSVAGIDLESALGTVYDLKPILDTNHYDKFWKVEEKLTTYHAKLDLDGNLFSIPYHGNVGAQLVSQSQHSIGNVIQNVGGVVKVLPYDKEIKYDNVLPSLNLNFDVAEGTILRFGAGRSMARPRMDDLRANANAGVALLAGTAITVPANASAGTWSGSGGNPALKPWLADSVDVSLEKYFSKGTYIAVAYYKKKLLSYIYNKQVNDYDFNGYPIIPTSGGITPVPYVCGTFSGATCAQYVPGTTGTFTRPENGQGGKADGVEISGNLDAGMLTTWLDGFGVSASYSRRWTDIRPNGPGTTERLPGFSGSNRNVTAYYEKNGFSARISERVRDAYRAEVTGLFSTRAFTDVLEDKQVDAQVQYTFPDGRFHGLTLLLQANNLTDSPYRTRLGGTFPGGGTQPQDYETYGKQILFGVNWKY